MSQSLTKRLTDTDINAFLADARADQTLLTLSELAARFNTTPRLIRTYEARNLLRPILAGTTPWYDLEAQGRLKQIEDARKLGMTYDEISELLDKTVQPPHRARAIRTIGNQITELEREQRQIERRLRRLRQHYYIVTDPEIDGA